MTEPLVARTTGAVSSLAACLLAVVLLACSEASAIDTKPSPAKVEPIPGSDLSEVTLLESAARRIALQTAPVRELDVGPRGEPGPVLVVDYSAIIYDLTGTVWVYTNPEALTYVRRRVSIAYIEANTVVLVEGPPAGTQVVVAGAAELYGAETGVGK